MDNFVHLHNHSEYSLLDGACRIKELVLAAKNAQQSAVAITDHGVMYGAVSFYNACRAEGIKGIIGCEMYVSPTSRFDKSRVGDDAYYHLILLCKNEVGYKNLIFLVSAGFTEGFYIKPRIDMELLAEHSEGLICLSGCLSGYIPKMLVRGRDVEAVEYAKRLKSIFGKDDFYIELQEHGIQAEEEVLPKLVRLARELDLNIVATNDIHYIKKNDAATQQVLMCIQTNTTVGEENAMAFETDEFYFKSGEQMRNIFSTYPESCENTAVIAEKCNFEFDFSHIYLPKFQTPDNSDTGAYLRAAAFKGLAKKIAMGEIKGGEKYTERLEYELSVIQKMGFDDYYLIVCDYVNYAKKSGIHVGVGRGSGAGSLAAYLIGITDIDPLKYGLMFERFLNPERVSMPDFDVDFADERRAEVIKYVTDKYGRDRVSQIITFNTLAARAAVRDCGRALGMSYSKVDSVAKMIVQKPKITVKQVLDDENDRSLHELYESDDEVRLLIDTACAVEGMPRNISTHAAGVVITEKPVNTLVPLASSGDMVLTQYDMDDISALGLVKFDFLGIRFLTIIENTQNMIRQHEPLFSIEKIPLDDSETFKMLSQGGGEGVFQLESEGMRRLLTQLCPRCIEDIIAAIALYRPGPMDSIPKFLQNRADPSKIKYISPKLKDILDLTFGVVVYQEQVMEIFRTLAGYSYGRADVVRRLMSKKKSELMAKERQVFLHGEINENGETVISGAVANGIDEASASALFDELEGFAKYAFNKSHAACYAFVTYRTAYLKCHYYAEYMASLLTNELGNLEKTAFYISLCRKNGIEVLPPDINESNVKYSVVYSDNGAKTIRYGLAAIKNVGINFTENIIKESKTKHFTSFCDFVRRMIRYDCNKKQLEALIKCGAFDSLGVYRSKLLACYDTIVDKESDTARASISGQIDLFGNDELSGDDFEYPNIPEFSLRDRLMLEKEAAGMYFSGHLLDDYSNNISDIEPKEISELIKKYSDDGEVLRENVNAVVCGIISQRNDKNTKNGDVMSFVTVEDRYGEIECLVFPKILEKNGMYLTLSSAVTVYGTLSKREDEDVKLTVREVMPLSPNDRYSKVKKTDEKKQTKEKTPSEPTLYLKVPSLKSEICIKAQQFLDVYTDEESNTEVKIFDTEKNKYFKRSLPVTVTKGLDFQLKKLLGDDCVVLK